MPEKTAPQVVDPCSTPAVTEAPAPVPSPDDFDTRFAALTQERLITHPEYNKAVQRGITKHVAQERKKIEQETQQKQQRIQQLQVADTFFQQSETQGQLGQALRDPNNRAWYDEVSRWKAQGANY